MTDLTLFMAPGTCAKVSMICLEETGAPFKTELVRFMKGEHKSHGYKKLNPKGKVPALIIDGEALTENVAIILHINSLFPDAKLLPHASSPLDEARQIADLCFCSATLHPIVTRIRMPQFFASENEARSVWEKGCAAMSEYFQLIEDRLTQGDWWYGAQWSAMDAYIYWVFWRVQGADFDTLRYPRFCGHAKRMEDRPSVQKAVAREADSQAQLEREGLVFKPSVLPEK